MTTGMDPFRHRWRGLLRRFDMKDLAAALRFAIPVSAISLISSLPVWGTALVVMAASATGIGITRAIRSVRHGTQPSTVDIDGDAFVIGPVARNARPTTIPFRIVQRFILDGLGLSTAIERRLMDNEVPAIPWLTIEYRDARLKILYKPVYVMADAPNFPMLCRAVADIPGAKLMISHKYATRDEWLAAVDTCEESMLGRRIGRGDIDDRHSITKELFDGL